MLDFCTKNYKEYNDVLKSLLEIQASAQNHLMFASWLDIKTYFK